MQAQPGPAQRYPGVWFIPAYRGAHAGYLLRYAGSGCSQSRIPIFGRSQLFQSRAERADQAIRFEVE